MHGLQSSGRWEFTKGLQPGLEILYRASGVFGSAPFPPASSTWLEGPSFHVQTGQLG